MRRIVDQTDGFTVLELLVSLALLTLITAHLSGALYQSRRVSEIQVRISDRLERQLIRHYLTSSLANAQSVFDAGSENQPMLAFDGTPDTLSFVAVNDSRLDRGGLYKHQVEVGDGEEGRSLVLTRNLFRPSISVSSSVETRTLLSGLDNATFRYFGTLAGEREAGWHDTWQSQKSLPQLIEMNVTYRDARHAPMPPLVVRIAAAN